MKWALVILWCFSLHAQQSGLIDSGESKLYYRTFGEGKPLLIINGGPGMNSNGFVGLAKDLSYYGMTIIYDQRGTGKSVCAIDPHTMTLDKMVGDMENLRRHLKLESWSIFGQSFGGMLASYYATKHPGRIDKIILSASGGVDLELREYVAKNIRRKLSKIQRDSLDYFDRLINRGDTSIIARSGRARALAPAYVFHKENAPVIAQRLLENTPQINGLLWANMTRINFDCTPGLKNFSRPVLVIYGRDDILDRKTAVRSAKALKIPNWSKSKTATTTAGWTTLTNTLNPYENS
jgi:proline iminopeptidase